MSTVGVIVFNQFNKSKLNNGISVILCKDLENVLCHSLGTQ